MKPRARISEERILIVAHRVVDGLQGSDLALYHTLNRGADIPALAHHIRWWLEAQGVDVTD